MLDMKLVNIGEESCAPGYQFGPYVRNFVLVHAVSDGKGVLENDFGRFPVHKGQAFFIFPQEVTVYRADEVEPWHYMWAGWVGGESMALLHKLGIRRQSPVLDLGSQAESIYACIRRTYEDSALGYAELATTGGLLRLLALLANCGNGGAHPAQAVYHRALWLMENEHADRPLTVESLSASLSISRSQLFRLFREAAGHSPKEALTRHRCDRAIRLIERTTLSMEEVAAACCFTSGQHLCDTFRRQGLSPPTSFRK